MSQSDIKPRPSRPALPHARETLEMWQGEEPALIARWQDAACAASLTLLLHRYEKLIHAQVRLILSRGALNRNHRADLIQEASLAFVRAVSDFDPEAGIRLSTYATRSIRGALLTYVLNFRNGYRVGTSSDERKAFYAAISMQNKRIAAGHSPNLNDADIETIRTATGASARATARAVQSIHSRMTAIEEAEALPLDRNPQDETSKSLSQHSAMQVLAPFIEELDDRKSAIFRHMTAQNPVSVREIADRFDITPTRIGQLRREMLKEMRDHLRAHGIEADCIF